MQVCGKGEDIAFSPMLVDRSKPCLYFRVSLDGEIAAKRLECQP